MLEQHVAGKTIVMVSASSGYEATIKLATCRIKMLEEVAAEITNGGDHIRERMKAEDETRKES
ncbi:hypothetical protein [Nitrosomonas sp. Nm34]|uniref:hypothetical protein n=1 Tax=Nitrosomonas sp. Nm34 TaxID=1881055 RepID=UPI0008F36564|nr:hypothetical protein [Nitrosomonas sp. Nm34]SFI34058.1 hypothetical protein SAMN05428978_100639 [Nitrosomonas sp. Nm34]